eukprot:Nk52_evm34s1763 gene=Nk52_evmTU34s1763
MEVEGITTRRYVFCSRELHKQKMNGERESVVVRVREGTKGPSASALGERSIYRKTWESGIALGLYVTEYFEDMVGPAEKEVEVVDVGCGTGLAGLVCAGLVRRTGRTGGQNPTVNLTFTDICEDVFVGVGSVEEEKGQGDPRVSMYKCVMRWGRDHYTFPELVAHRQPLLRGNIIEEGWSKTPEKELQKRADLVIITAADVIYETHQQVGDPRGSTVSEALFCTLSRLLHAPECAVTVHGKEKEGGCWPMRSKRIALLGYQQRDSCSGVLDTMLARYRLRIVHHASYEGDVGDRVAILGDVRSQCETGNRGKKRKLLPVPGGDIEAVNGIRPALPPSVEEEVIIRKTSQVTLKDVQTIYRIEAIA